MRVKMPVLVLLVASLLAGSGPLDLMQTFAWGRMIVTYSRTMSVGQAIRKTFSGEAMCGVCEFVATARDQHDGEGSAKAVVTKDPVKFLTLGVTREPVLSTPRVVELGRCADPAAILATPRAAPPLPPPRGLG